MCICIIPFSLFPSAVYFYVMPTFDETVQDKKLATLHHKEEEELAHILSQKYGLPYIDLSRESVNTDALRIITETVSREAEVAVFQKVNMKVALAVRSPNNEHLPAVIKDLEERGYKPALHMVSRASLERAWGYYKDVSFAIETESGVLDVSGDEIKKLLEQINSLDAAKKAIENVLGMKMVYRITRILETMIAGALSNNASDIHLEPEEKGVGVRFRIDGVLVHIFSIDELTYAQMLSRIKLLSGLKLNIKDAAQDGRFSVKIDSREIEIRTSILPGNYGESIVTRLLDPTSIGLPLEKLGMSQIVLDLLAKEVEKPNGMILNTGPTGSGKTTTLYAFLKRVSNPEVKVLTIEDPIEYHLGGIVQTQVNHKDYTFATGLRSALRQDPDVIMVGEIRDNEVAATAVQAALTGHLVFSTLHTNNAAGAFPRLIDLGIDASTIGSAINAVMAQRLVRTINPKYKKEVPLVGEDRAFVEAVLDRITNKSLIPANIDHVYVPDAPEGELGYKGRVAVYEVIVMTRDLETAVRKNLTTRELAEVTKPQGIPSLHEDAILKVLAGQTTVDEVRRTLGDITMAY